MVQIQIRGPRKLNFKSLLLKLSPALSAVLGTVLETNASVKSAIKTALLLKSATINLTVTYITAVHPYFGGDR